MNVQSGLPCLVSSRNLHLRGRFDQAVSCRASGRAKLSLRHIISTYTVYCPVLKEIKCDSVLFVMNITTYQQNWWISWLISALVNFKGWRLGSFEVWQSSLSLSSPDWSFPILGPVIFFATSKQMEEVHKLTPLKINMKPKNHPIEKGQFSEPNLHFWVPAVNFPACKAFDDSSAPFRSAGSHQNLSRDSQLSL